MEHDEERRTTARQLKNRRESLRAAEEAYCEALAKAGLHPPVLSMDGGRRQQNATGDPTARSAALISRAEDRLLTAQRWARLGDDVAMMVSREAQDVFDMLYTDGMNCRRVAEVLHVQRQAVYRWNDEILLTATVLAKERGLI